MKRSRFDYILNFGRELVYIGVFEVFPQRGTFSELANVTTKFLDFRPVCTQSSFYTTKIKYSVSGNKPIISISNPL